MDLLFVMVRELHVSLFSFHVFYLMLSCDVWEKTVPLKLYSNFSLGRLGDLVLYSGCRPMREERFTL
jgi:hypothetical protein